jgi:hypothetical protein
MELENQLPLRKMASWTVKSPSRRQRLFADSAIRNPQIDEEKKPRTDGKKSADR